MGRTTKNNHGGEVPLKQIVNETYYNPTLAFAERCLCKDQKRDKDAATTLENNLTDDADRFVVVISPI